MVQIMGRQLKPTKYKKLCHLEAPHHDKIIQPGQTCYQIVEGKAQGIYHNIHCYQAALKQYEQMEKLLKK